MSSDQRTDLVGNILYPHDSVVMARPIGRRGGGKLEKVTIVKFTDQGVTVRQASGNCFNTPYRADKFLRVGRGIMHVGSF